MTFTDDDYNDEKLAKLSGFLGTIIAAFLTLILSWFLYFFLIMRFIHFGATIKTAAIVSTILAILSALSVLLLKKNPDQPAE